MEVVEKNRRVCPVELAGHLNGSGKLVTAGVQAGTIEGSGFEVV